jgi:hypothetical protein
VLVQLRTLTPPCQEVAVLRLRDFLKTLNVSAPFFFPTRPKPPVSILRLPLPSLNGAISLTVPSVTSVEHTHFHKMLTIRRMKEITLGLMWKLGVYYYVSMYLIIYE